MMNHCCGLAEEWLQINEKPKGQGFDPQKVVLLVLFRLISISLVFTSKGHWPQATHHVSRQLRKSEKE
jgi:hypothetical protein